MRLSVKSRSVGRFLLTLAAVISLIAASGVLYGWRQSYKHAIGIRRIRVSEAKAVFVSDAVVLNQGEFLWHRSGSSLYYLVPRKVLHPHYSQMVQSRNLGRYPRGEAVIWDSQHAANGILYMDGLRIAGFYVGRLASNDPFNVQSFNDDQGHSVIIFPLWLPLVIFLILPLAWVRSWLRWRKLDPHTKAGFDPVIAQQSGASAAQLVPAKDADVIASSASIK
jgi:hypothetical protein